MKKGDHLDTPVCSSWWLWWGNGLATGHPIQAHPISTYLHGIGDVVGAGGLRASPLQPHHVPVRRLIGGLGVGGMLAGTPHPGGLCVCPRPLTSKVDVCGRGARRGPRAGELPRGLWPRPSAPCDCRRGHDTITSSGLGPAPRCRRAGGAPPPPPPLHCGTPASAAGGAWGGAGSAVCSPGRPVPPHRTSSLPPLRTSCSDV
jgi:hypothetical protein